MYWTYLWQDARASVYVETEGMLARYHVSYFITVREVRRSGIDLLTAELVVIPQSRCQLYLMVRCRG